MIVAGEVSGWEIGSTLATVFAVALALAIAVAPPLYRRYWKCPKITIQCEATDPFVRGARDGAVWQYLRAKITNNGRGPANNVRAVVVRVAEVGADELEIDPFELHWVSLAPPRLLVQVTPTEFNVQPGPLSSRLDLTPKDYDFVDVCRHSGAHLELVPHDERSRGFSFECPNRTAPHEVVIRVSADEIDPTEFLLRFEFVLGATGQQGRYRNVNVERIRS